MIVIFLYYFLGVPSFFEQPQAEYKHKPVQHILVERCKMPNNPIFFTQDRPFGIGDTVLVTAPKSAEFYFARVVDFQE